MFKFLPDDLEDFVTIQIDGETVSVPQNISVAAAVLAQGKTFTRTTAVSGSERAPLCMMGVCYECLMIIDGQANRRACQETVAEGMKIECQFGTGRDI